MDQNDIYERIISTMIDSTRERVAFCDEEYLRLEEKRAELEELYQEIEIYSSALNLLNSYISLVQKTDMRFADISYMSGVKDTISLMSKFGYFDPKEHFIFFHKPDSTENDIKK